LSLERKFARPFGWPPIVSVGSLGIDDWCTADHCGHASDDDELDLIRIEDPKDL